MSKLHIAIISPAQATANNGNWHTAQRWARFLRERYRVTACASSADAPADADAAIALHARRSAQAISSYAARFPSRPIAVVLTGTDLYRDIHADADAQRSLALAARLVVLQDRGLQELNGALREKTIVIHQSAHPLKPAPRDAGRRRFRVTMIGHLRDEKDPLTYIRAAALIGYPAITMTHVGSALDPSFAAAAQAMQRNCARYRWLDGYPHAKTRQHLKRSDLMVITSRMEGGANVIIEAVTSGVPVIASDIPGNRGMLGEDYAGYFPVGDSAALAEMIERTYADPAFHRQLENQCALRAPLFLPGREKAALLQLVDNLFAA